MGCKTVPFLPRQNLRNTVQYNSSSSNQASTTLDNTSTASRTWQRIYIAFSSNLCRLTWQSSDIHQLLQIRVDSAIAPKYIHDLHRSLVIPHILQGLRICPSLRLGKREAEIRRPPWQGSHQDRRQAMSHARLEKRPPRCD